MQSWYHVRTIEEGRMGRHGAQQIRAVLLLVVLAGLLPLAPAATAQEVRQQNGVTYVTGGNSDAERRELATVANREGMTLRLVFSDTRETPVSPVEVTIMDGESLVLRTTSTGPWLCARLPAGEYQIRAAHRGTVREASLTVPAEGHKEIVITYPWSPKG
jgi:hypothetical protein